MVTSFSLEQLENASSLIVIKELLMTTFFRLLPVNDDLPMLTTESGNSKSSKSQLMNAKSSMTSTVSGMKRWLSLVQPQNTLRPIFFRPLGKIA